MIGALLVIIAVAIGALVYTFIGNGDDDGSMTSQFHFQCVIEECGHKWELTEEEAVKAGHFQGPPEMAKSMPHMWLPIDCPKCGGEKTGYRCTPCPACKGWYLPEHLRGEAVSGMGECPLCGVNIQQWHKDQWRKRKGGG